MMRIQLVKERKNKHNYDVQYVSTFYSLFQFKNIIKSPSIENNDSCNNHNKADALNINDLCL